MDAPEIGAVFRRNGVKLVGDGELDVAPSVREQLGQLGLKDRNGHRLYLNSLKKLFGAVDGLVREAGDNLREHAELPKGVPLHRAPWAEGKVHVEPPVGKEVIHPLRGSRINRAAQHHMLTAPQVLGHFFG